MAIFRPGAIVAAVSGSSGGTIFKQTRNGPVVTSRPGQVDRDTQPQAGRRAIFSQARRRWAALTQDKRDPWYAIAATMTRTNRLGLQVQPSAFQLYTSYNSYALAAGATVESRPPKLGTSPQPTIVDITWVSNTGILVEYTTAAAHSDAYEFLYLQAHLRALPPQTTPSLPLAQMTPTDTYPVGGIVAYVWYTGGAPWHADARLFTPVPLPPVGAYVTASLRLFKPDYWPSKQGVAYSEART